MDAVRQQRRQRDHGLHHHAVRRLDRADAGSGGRVRDVGDGDGPDERGDLHVPRDATNAVGTSPASEPSNATTPQATIFDFASPAVADSGDGSSVEVGVKFKSDSSGTITGLRFYKAAANTGTHVGTLWTASGTALAW